MENEATNLIKVIKKLIYYFDRDERMGVGSNFHGGNFMPNDP